jgi:hypothetical protein
LTNSSLENLDANNNNINKNKKNNNNILSVPELTQEQVHKLIEKYPEIDIDYYLEKIKDYEERKNKKYSSYYLTLLNWIKRDIERNNTYSKIVTIKEKENKKIEIEGLEYEGV